MELALRGHLITEPRDIPPLLARLEETRPQLIDAHRANTMRSIHELEGGIAESAAERRFVRRILNWLKNRTVKGQIATLHKADLKYSSALDQTIAHVQSLLNSAELAGAQAELHVIGCLRKLPSSTTVFNDVRLRATRHIHFNGAALLSAQIDHIVLTPAGVFVVETKRWSRRFVQSGDFHDPFDQTSRAAYLCYDLLRERFGKTRVRSVIACTGNLPDAPIDSYIKVVKPEELNRYIAGFRNMEFGAERLNELCRFFEDRVGALIGNR